MHELRCTKCGKLLLKANKPHEASLKECELEIKCKHCKATNRFKAK